MFTAGTGSLQYGLTEGYMPLRERLCRGWPAKGMKVQPDQMILTTGSQQAIDLITRVLMEPGDIVLVENPTYLASLQVFNLSGLRIIPVASDKDGMIMEDAQRLIKAASAKACICCTYLWQPYRTGVEPGAPQRTA